MLNRSKLKCRRAARRTNAIRYTALMGILIGMDEAGYGPHLGPLVIAATVWHVPDEPPNRGSQRFDDGMLASATVKPRRKANFKVGASTNGATAIAEVNPQSAIGNPQSQ